MYFVRPACFAFLYNVYPKILYFRKNWAKYHKSVYVFKASAFFVPKTPNIKFYKNPYIETGSMQIHRRDEANSH